MAEAHHLCHLLRCLRKRQRICRPSDPEGRVILHRLCYKDLDLFSKLPDPFIFILHLFCSFLSM